MLNLPATNKRATILCAAMDVFVTYGFRKTSMDDIARAAGMSRPALYQLFRNKTDIFRALVEEIMVEAAENARSGFAQPGPFRDRLFMAIDASILEMHRFIETTPHGLELISVNEEVAADLDDKWQDVMVGVISSAIEASVRDGELDLSSTNASPERAATVFMKAMEGMRSEVLRGRPIEHHVEALVDFFAGALQRR